MYVYELAIQLGKRSTDLTDAADQLGFGPLIAASELTAEQHAKLVHHFTGMVVSGPMPTSTIGALGASGAPAAPTLVAPGPPRSGGSKAGLVAGAVVAVVVLLGGAYALVGGQRDEFGRQVDAQAAADARGEIPESEPSDDAGEPDGPAPAPADAPADAPTEAPATTALDPTDDAAVKRARCAASQKISDLDDQGDVLNTDAPTWEQFVWAIDQAEAMLPELKVAYDELRAVAPGSVQGDIDAVWRITEDMTRQLSAVTSPDQLRGAVDSISARESEIAGPLMRLNDFTEGECGITIAD